MQWHAMAAATQRQRRKFNPPVKKLSTPTTPALSQESCSSNLSWSLPPTQTHTVLSYCESEDGISTDSHKDTNAAACTDSGPSLAPGTLCKTMAVSPGNAERDNSKILKRKYNYCMFPHRAGKPTTTNRCDHKPKSGRHSVYEYLLTPSEPVTQAKAPRQRNKEQVETDKAVLGFIAKTRAEIEVIRNQYLTIKMQRAPPVHTHSKPKDSEHAEREE